MKKKNSKKEYLSETDVDDTDAKGNTKTQSGKSKSRRQKSDTNEPSVNAQQSLLLSAAGDPVGLTKKDFVYDRKSANMAPPIIIQAMFPLSGLYAWSDEAPLDEELGYGNLDDLPNPYDFEDYTSETSPIFPKSGVDPVIFAQNSITQDFTNLVWPSYAALFESGLRDDVDITQSTFIRILLCTHMIYSGLQSLNMLIDMWKQASDNPSNELSRLILRLTSTDPTSIVQAKVRAQIEGLSVKIGHLPVMPEMVLETRRMLTPFIDPSLPETLIYTIHKHIIDHDLGVQKFLDNAHNMLDILYSSYHDEIATMKTFIPTTVLSESAVVPGSIGVDPIRAVGRYNSAIWSKPLVGKINGSENTTAVVRGYEVSLAGQTLKLNDYTNPGHLAGEYTSLCWAPAVNQASTFQPFRENRFFQTIGEAISFIEVLSTTIYYRQLHTDSIPDTVGFAMMTPHTWGELIVMDGGDRDNLANYMPAAIIGSKISGENKMYSEIIFRRIGIAIVRNSSNRAYTRYPHYRRGVLDPNNLRASLVKIAPMLFNLPGVQILDVSQAGKFISPSQPGVKAAYKSM